MFAIGIQEIFLLLLFIFIPYIISRTFCKKTAHGKLDLFLSKFIVFWSIIVLESIILVIFGAYITTQNFLETTNLVLKNIYNTKNYITISAVMSPVMICILWRKIIQKKLHTQHIKNIFSIIIITAALVYAINTEFITKFDTVHITPVDGLGRSLTSTPFFAKYFLLKGELWAGWLWSITDSVIFFSLLYISYHTSCFSEEKNKKNILIQFIMLFSVVLALIFCSRYFSQENSLHANATKKLELSLIKKLDNWADNKTYINSTSILAESCGKLIMIYSTKDEIDNYMQEEKTHKGEYNDFQYKGDVCVKLTAQRVSPQDEFKNRKIVDNICNKTSITRIDYFFRELCKKANLIK